MIRNLVDKLKWIGIGVCVGALVLWRLLRQRGPAPVQKKELEAALEKERADRVVVEPVPVDLAEVKKKLRERGLLS